MKLPVVMNNRRQFLLGAGGAALAVPLLPSLLSEREARAAMAGTKNFAYFELPHGAVLQADMFPADAMLTDSQSYAGHTIRRGKLDAAVANGEARLSNVLRAPSTELTSSLVGKLNVIRGVDVAHYPAHGAGQTLGNFSDMTGGVIDEGVDWKLPTIDQVMAYSSAVYPATPAERSIVLGEISWQHENPAAKTGAIKQLKPFAGDNLALFDKLFGAQPATTGTPKPPNTRLVDKVLENYKRVRDGGKLSSVDRMRLDDHVQRIAELQAKLARPLAGTSLPRPTKSTNAIGGGDDYAVNPALQADKWNLWTDVVAAAFSVGATRLFVAFANDTFANYTLDWHDLAHSFEAVRRDKFAGANQLFFSKVFLGLARKLDGIAMPDGSSLLDSSLLAYSHESGSFSHMGQGFPIVTFGSAQGFARTGQYLDYRNLDKAIDYGNVEKRWHGLVWHQWLGTALQAMGVPKTEYPGLSGGTGYPTHRSSELSNGSDQSGDPNEEQTIWRYKGTAPAYPDSVWSAAATDVLPWLRA